MNEIYRDSEESTKRSIFRYSTYPMFFPVSTMLAEKRGVEGEVFFTFLAVRKAGTEVALSPDRSDE